MKQTAERLVTVDMADPAKALKSPELAARMARDMDPEQVKNDLRAEFLKRSSFTRPDGTETLSGKRLIQTLRESRESLLAAGFTEEELKRIERVGSTLNMIDARSPKEVAQLLEDAPGTVLRLVAAIAGAKWGQRIAGAGMGSSLVLAQFGSRVMQDRLKSLLRDDADLLLRAAMTNKELFAALLVRPTSPVKEQVRAARIINAFLVPAALDEREDREQQ
jgi:hypothetical protein